MTQIPKELDAITDKVLAYRPPAQRALSQPEAWSLSIDRIFEESGLRLDAARFNPELDFCMDGLESLGVPLEPLDKLANLQLPGRFERVWAKDAKHGVPYLNATDLLSLFAVGLPTKNRFLSRQSDVDMDSLIIRQNWLLMTCSGTIGRVFHVPGRLDGWGRNA